MFTKHIQSSAILVYLLLFSLHLVKASNRIQDQSLLSDNKDRSTIMQDPVSKVISSSPLLSFHRSLCEIESITDNENAVGEYLFSYLKKHNFHVLRQEVPQPSESEYKTKRFNVFAWPKGNTSDSTSTVEDEVDQEDDELGDFAPKVILTSHIDTVPPFIPYSASIASSSPDSQGEKLNRSEILLHGRGTVDAKACVAAQTHAILSLLPSPSKDTQTPPPPVALLFVVGEERSGDGMKTFSSSSLHSHLSNSYSTLIFGEPTESLLASGHKGLVMFRLIARGKAAHSGYPWLGRSANSMLIPVLAKIDKVGDRPESEGGLPKSEKYGKSTVNIGRMQGGVAANVVPEHAEAEVAVRLAGGTPEGAREIIEKAVREANGGGDGDVEVVFTGPAYPPQDLDADIPGFESMSVNYGTDVPNLEVRAQGEEVFVRSWKHLGRARGS
jgi:acetylornithine deacetylase